MLLVLLVLLVLVLLVLLPCSPSCCLCCVAALLLGAPALVAAPHVPTPHVSFERKIVFRNTSSCFTCALISRKRHCIENRKVFPALLAA